MKNIFKKLAVVLAAAALALSIPATIHADGGISIFVDSKDLNTDVPPKIINGRTMVPVRAVSEAVGCKVDWFGDDQRIVVYSPAGGDPLLVMHVNNPVVTLNHLNGDTGVVTGERVTIESPPVIIDGRTLVPLRFIAETIGYMVNWDANTQTVYLYSALYEDPDWGDSDPGSN